MVVLSFRGLRHVKLSQGALRRPAPTRGRHVLGGDFVQRLQLVVVTEFCVKAEMIFWKSRVRA